MQSPEQIESALANVTSRKMEKNEVGVLVANLMDQNAEDDILTLAVFDILRNRYWTLCIPYAAMLDDAAVRNADFQQEQSRAPRQVIDAYHVHKRWIDKYNYLCGRLEKLVHGKIQHQEMLLKYICRVQALSRGFWHYDNVQQSYP